MTTYFLPLWACARLYGDLAAGRLGPAGEQVARAMQAHPELVGGEGCGDTELMRGQGGATAKTGAEGLLVLGLKDGTGLALKPLDGAERAVDPLAIAVLRQDLGLPCSTAALNRLAGAGA